jgi:hypothetical protein
MQRSLSKWMTRGLYRGGDRSEESLSRPLAVSVILAGYDQTLKSTKMALVDNTGLCRSCRFATLGAIPGGPSTIARLRDIFDAIPSNDDKNENFMDISKEILVQVAKIAHVLWDEPMASLDYLESHIGSLGLSAQPTVNSFSDSDTEDIEVECCVIGKHGVRRTGWHSSPRALVAAAKRVMTVV